MEPTMAGVKTAVVATFLLLFFAVFLLNALTMVISPRAWFRLPEWIRASGSMTLKREKYSHGWGSVQVRFLGFAFLAGGGWMVFMMLLYHR
jgi:hypothetical protein